jgi:hypothetical protein
MNQFKNQHRGSDEEIIITSSFIEIAPAVMKRALSMDDSCYETCPLHG